MAVPFSNYANFKFNNPGLNLDTDQFGNWTLTSSTATTSTSNNHNRQSSVNGVGCNANRKKEVKKPAMYKLKEFNDKLKNIC